VAVWAEERLPTSNEVWEQVKPLLAAAGDRRKGAAG
jgi:hypothetical protein